MSPKVKKTAQNVTISNNSTLFCIFWVPSSPISIWLDEPPFLPTATKTCRASQVWWVSGESAISATWTRSRKTNWPIAARQISTPAPRSANSRPSSDFSTRTSLTTWRRVRGFAKLRKFKKSKIKLDRAHPTRPLYKLFLNPLPTSTEHSNHNN